MRYAIALEKKYSKDDILKGYLNIAAFGGRVYGIESAAKYYFGGKTAADLTLAEAASLIAIVNHPEKFRLDYPESETNGANSVNEKGEPTPYAENKQRRDYILEQMLKEKKITQEEHDAAVATPVAPVITEPSTGCQSAARSAFFCDYVKNIILNHYDDPATEDVYEGANLLRGGGLQIFTTLDLELQDRAETAIDRERAVRRPPLRRRLGRRHRAAGNRQGPRDGAEQELQRRPRGHERRPRVLSDQPQHRLRLRRLQRTAARLDLQGVHARRVAERGPLAARVVQRRTTCLHVVPRHVRRRQLDRRTFNPRNDDGRIANNAVNATKWSVNTSFMAMASQLQLCGIKETAAAFGVHRADGAALGEGVDSDGNQITFGPSAVLGTEEIAPITMAAAFAGIANNGLTCTPIAIEKIVKPDGEELAPPADDVHAVGHPRGRARDGVRHAGDVHGRRHGDGLEHRHRSSAHRQDRYDRRRLRHLDDRCRARRRPRRSGSATSPAVTTVRTCAT